MEKQLKNALAALAKLGIKAAALEKDDFNADEAVKAVTSGIIENNRDEIEAEATKTASTAAYNKFVKDLVKMGELDANKYAKLEKDQYKTALADFKAIFDEKVKAAEGGGGDGDSEKSKGQSAELKKQLADLQATYNAALAENKQLKTAIEEHPAALETAKKQVMSDYAVKEHIRGGFQKLRANGLSSVIDDDMLEAKLNASGAKFKTIEAADGSLAFQIVDANGKLIKKSESEAFTDVYDYMSSKVIKPEWIVKNGDAGAGGGSGAGSTGTGGSGGTGKVDAVKVNQALPPALQIKA